MAVGAVKLRGFSALAVREGEGGRSCLRDFAVTQLEIGTRWKDIGSPGRCKFRFPHSRPRLFSRLLGEVWFGLCGSVVANLRTRTRLISGSRFPFPSTAIADEVVALSSWTAINSGLRSLSRPRGRTFGGLVYHFAASGDDAGSIVPSSSTHRRSFLVRFCSRPRPR
ncbi:hypothetical protein EJ06DRAFT_320644 [Trichodelitschia bisporula]|uniref:Uncharacterized protein n=1 Tax=Trichodelitschia bisporula TaxID=703511 RepID=A0A6G1I4Y5_9PEZI|nr:hypothetical protein EJ06DRAFT_320644 [Trichodelitschia bisporula]